MRTLFTALVGCKTGPARPRGMGNAIDGALPNNWHGALPNNDNTTTFLATAMSLAAASKH
jgi:hypothetical protein